MGPSSAPPLLAAQAGQARPPRGRRRPTGALGEGGLSALAQGGRPAQPAPVEQARPHTRSRSQAALAHVAAKARQLLAVVAVTALSAGVLSALAPEPASASTNGTVLFVHSFTQNSLSGDGFNSLTASGAVELPSAPGGSNVVCLTVAGGAGTPASCSPAPDSSGNGVLQLTPDTGGQEGALFSTLALPTSHGLDVTFDSYQYQPSGSGADGLAFVVAAVNPSTLAGPSSAGNPGGSLGYAPSGSSHGLSYGYLGMGLDVYGNYSTSGVDGTGCTDPAYIVLPAGRTFRGR
jgi:hypothetical protein